MIDWLLSECVPRQTTQEARVGKIQNVFNISTKIESNKIWSQLGYPGFTRPPLFSPRIGLLLDCEPVSLPESEQKPNPQQSLHFPFILSFFQKVDWIIPVDLLLIAPVYFGPVCSGGQVIILRFRKLRWVGAGAASETRMLPGNFSHKIFKFSAKSIDSLSQNSSPRFLSRGELRGWERVTECHGVTVRVFV